MMRRISPCLLLLLLAACNGVQSSNGRDGSDSVLIASLFELFLWTTAAVYVAVLAWLALAVWRGRRRAGTDLRHRGSEAGWRLGLSIFAGATALILAALSIGSWLTDRSLARAGADPAMEIEVTGHQWWWEVTYKSPVPSSSVRTANELHLPVGKTVLITLRSDDVIHSLWIPNLAGKRDLIPGRPGSLTLHPLRAGVFRSQCAEFCGLQHARMALDVTVESPDQFNSWYTAQQQPPAVPTSGPAAAGYVLFQGRQCSSCHTIAGTPASGTVAPDLSHVAGRRTIAAGTLPTTHANLVAWIRNPQGPKPGNNMPRVPLSPTEIEQLSAYLETLR